MATPVRVSKQFSQDWDFCMSHWLSLEDGFSQADVDEAKVWCREIINEQDVPRINEMQRWFAQEAYRIGNGLRAAA